MSVGGKESKRTVTCMGSFLEIPGKFAGPKTYFLFAIFRSRSWYWNFWNLNNRHQDTKHNYLLFELKMDNSSLELDLKILLRVWKVTGTFEKQTPGQDHMLSTSSKNTLIVLLALTQGHRDIIVWSMFLADKGIRI